MAAGTHIKHKYRPAYNLERRKIMKTIQIFYGDSNTYGYDPRSFLGDQYPAEIRWTGILKNQTDWDIRNHGICGRSIPHTESQIKFACEQIQNWAKQENPPYIWIMLGTNDLLDNQNFTAEDVTDRMRNFLTEIMKQPAIINKQIHLGLISPASMEYGAWVDSDRLYEESRRLHTEYRHLSEKLNLLFISTENWNIPVIFDGVHFSEEGHRIFAAQIKTELSRIEKA